MGKISIDIRKGELAKAEIVVGIDLGTTNSLIAYVNPETGAAECIGGSNGIIVPSVVYLQKDVKPLVGNPAKRALIESPESTVYSVKRLLGRSYQDIEQHADYFTYRIIDDGTDRLVQVESAGKYYNPIELSAFILAELKSRAEQALNVKIQKAVVTVPAYFNDSQRQATRDAGKLAGLDVLRIVNEPTAASLAYGIGLGDNEPRTVLIYDLGGGTFDVSILHLENGVFEVLSTNGNTYLGGDDIDRSIVTYWLESLQLNALQLSRETIQELRLMAEAAKIAVSTGQGHYSSVFPGMEGTMLKLTKEILEALCKPILDKTFDCVAMALQDAGKTKADLDEVVLVGGSTRLPMVRERLAALFSGIKIDTSINPDEVVALGAAIEADILAGNRRDILLIDVTPLSLGIETAGGLMDVIIPRNSKVPQRVGRQYTTSVDGQANMKISVYQGERELVAENRKLAEFQLNNIPAMPAGLPKVEIGFMLDADGILKVSATELRSGVSQQIEVKPQYGLSDEMVENMLMESLKNAESDMEKRMLVEAETEAGQLIYATERFIEKNPGLLNHNELDETMDLVQQLRDAIQSGQRAAILGGIDALNQYTRPFAEKLMDVAVGQALKGTRIE